MAELSLGKRTTHFAQSNEAEGKLPKPYTIQTRVRVLKVFSSWLFGEGYQALNFVSPDYNNPIPCKASFTRFSVSGGTGVNGNRG